ncbi:hypothetical protein [Paenibacillus sp. 32352]|uniref:hypothetical protein n=1 Tax=Paenibacillus sp. 32352 TaxID=1969111 RepID=UPI0015C4C7E5|nr:hypothetical protein [Paenibacillus sp. 32352]
MKWQEVIQEVTKFKKSHKYAWFRGHSDVSYELKSSLFRQNLSSVEDFLVNERAI